MIQNNLTSADLVSLTWLAAFLAGFLVFFIIILIVTYVYVGFAFMTIGRKAKLKNLGLSWIPIFGPLIIAYQVSKMHWWPWLLLIGFIIPFVNIIAIILFAIFATTWFWKLFEKIKKPGWWALVWIGSIIPFIGTVFFIAQLVIYGIAAWSKN